MVFRREARMIALKKPEPKITGLRLLMCLGLFSHFAFVYRKFESAGCALSILQIQEAVHSETGCPMPCNQEDETNKYI